MTSSQVRTFTENVFAENMHLKRVDALARAVEGTLKSGALGISAIGQGLAAVHHLNSKHAVKQVDRLMSNEKLDVDELTRDWVSYVTGNMDKMVVNLDWTEFDKCDQSMLVLGLQTGKGRSTPLIWKTVVKSQLKNKRNDVEDELLERFKGFLKSDVQVTVVADRGFCDVALYEHLTNLGFDFVIRFRSNILVTDQKGEQKKAKEWISKGGRSRALRNVQVTGKKFDLATVVVAHDKKMKEGWYLASSLSEATAGQLKKLYGRRFTIEETFRDIKDIRYGFGLSWTRVGKPARRDRLFLLATMAHALLTLLGEAGETLGMDRMLKVNTSKRRQHSLFRQGRMLFELVPTMPEERLNLLLPKFGELLEATKLYSYLKAFEAAEK